MGVLRNFPCMFQQRDALSDKIMPWYYYTAVLGLVGMFLFYMGGLINLLLGRERVIAAQMIKFDVEVGPRRNRVTSFFEGAGRNYTWESSKAAPVEQSKPMELVVDGLFWDEIVEMRQNGKVAWKRI